MERPREKAASHWGRRIAEGGGRRKMKKRRDLGAGGRHGQGHAGASACGDGIDGHISHSSVSRRDHRTWLRGGSAWSAVADFPDICRWGDTRCDKDCPRHQILSMCWAAVVEVPSNLGYNDKASSCSFFFWPPQWKGFSIFLQDSQHLSQKLDLQCILNGKNKIKSCF